MQFERLLFEPYSLSHCSLFVPISSGMMKAPQTQEPPCDTADASLHHAHPLIDTNDISWLGGSALSQA